jgi:hypothetical protein
MTRFALTFLDRRLPDAGREWNLAAFRRTWQGLVRPQKLVRCEAQLPGDARLDDRQVN